ncbi:TRAP transporter substrate-binding protein [Acuticoccus mangrovi]|nr:TRAP transporter substrate-binding protein [Acuticoccus mangrovi]
MKQSLAALAALGLATSAQATDLVMQSIYAGTLPLLGDTGRELGERVSTLTNGELNIEFNDPGAIVASNEIWDAVSTGAVDAGWYSPGFAQGIIPAAGLFTAPPFGPDVKEYTAWWYYGGGRELWNEIGGRYDIHSVLCTILVPEASGWFRKPIEKVEDLQGLKMRIFGLGARVMQKLGVQAQSLPPADTMTALRLGTIDSAEMSFPAIDLNLELNTYADNYYFPGWHQQTSLITFIINTDVWAGLSKRDQAAIEEVCAANVALTSARGESMQLEPMATLREKGVTFHKWNDEMLDAFRGAWLEVAAEMSAEDEDFARAWKSLQDFHEKYADWADYGYLK